MYKTKDNFFVSEVSSIVPTPGEFVPISDLDVLIALQKGSQSCTSHHWSKFAPYAHLSSSNSSHVFFFVHPHLLSKCVSEAII